MKQSDQIAAMAEAMGWKRLKQRFYTHLWSKPNTDAPSYPLVGHENIAYPPDFPNDLNATEQAEEWLRNNGDGAWEEYCRRLGFRDGMTYGECWDMLHAPASKRLEEMLKTIGKWRDE